MAENSKIEWCDHTFNPWIGCARVSEGCRHCYAENLMDTRWRKVQWGPKGDRLRTSEAKWREPIKWNERAMREGTRFRVFCASLADVFEDKAEVQPWRDELFALMAYTQYLDWQVLTKRPENIRNMVPPHWLEHWPEHIWIGTSVETQEMADNRIGYLMYVPAAVRFLSCEPLLGPLQIQNYLSFGDFHGIDWVIVGAESGAHARPMEEEWVRNLRDQTVFQDAAFFYKQKVVGGRKIGLPLLDGVQWAEFPRVAVAV